MLEFTIVGIVLFMLIIGLFEYGRFMSAKSVITAAADRAAALAASDILIDTTGTSPNAIARAQEIIASSFIASVQQSGSAAYLLRPVTITAPGAIGTDGKISQKDLSNNPIRVDIDACIVPLFPGVRVFFNSGGGDCGSNVPVHAFAAAYRESSRSASLPVESDCLGRPVGSPDFYQNCPCISGKSWDPTLRQCVCNNGATTSDCSCAGNQYLNTTNGLCMCNVGLVSCIGPRYSPDAITCACGCYAPDESARCTSPPYGFTPGNWDDVSCSCSCPGSSTMNPSGSCKCPNGASEACTDRGPYWIMNNECSCECMSGRDWICENSGGTWNTSTCSCDCVAPMREFYGECKCSQQQLVDCANQNKELDETTCTCICSDAARGECERDGGTFNNGTCGCQCPPGLQWDGWTYGGGMGQGCYDPDAAPPSGGSSSSSSASGFSSFNFSDYSGYSSADASVPYSEPSSAFSSSESGYNSSEPCPDCGVNE